MGIIAIFFLGLFVMLLIAGPYMAVQFLSLPQLAGLPRWAVVSIVMVATVVWWRYLWHEWLAGAWHRRGEEWERRLTHGLLARRTRSTRPRPRDNGTAA